MTAREAGVVGAGRVGLSLAAALDDRGGFDDVWVAGRQPERPKFLRGREEIDYGVLDRWTRELPGRPADQLLLFFCVPDRSIGEAARSWGRGLAGSGLLSDPAGEASSAPRLRAVFHTSGSRPASELAPLGEGADAEPPPAASLHPLCAVARPDPAVLDGVTFGVEGDPEAVELAAGVAERIGGRALRVSPGEKARYHAGAVMSSNLLAACLGAGLRQLRQATGGAATVEDLLPLARSALDQVARHGLQGGMTGPVVRGDVGTVEAHLRGLDPTTRRLYASLTTELLRHAEPASAVRRSVERALASIEGGSADGRAGDGQSARGDSPSVD